MKKRAFSFLLLFLIFLSVEPFLLSQERFRKSPPFPEPLQELNLPVLETATLSNGLTLCVAFRENLPLIGMQLVIQAGESSSPPDLPGVATFTAHMMERGTASLTSSQIEEMIESIGGNFSISTSYDYSLFSFSFPEEYLDEVLSLLSQMILQPAFMEREIDTVKRILFYDVLGKGRDAQFLAKRQLLQLLFKNHPYRNATFTEDSIKNIDQKDVISFFEKYYRPNNALLVLTGNLNLTTASKKVSHYLNTWQNQDLEHSLLPSPEANAEERVCFIELPKAKDCTILLGNIILSVTSPAFFPILVLNQVLGGTPNSRLFMNLRESKGYAYFAFSEVEFHKSCGVFIINAKVAPDTVYVSIQEILKELRTISKEKIPTSEIEQAKSYLIGNFPLKIENLNDFCSKISDIENFNLGEEHWNEYYENIMLIDSEKVFEVAQGYSLLTPVIVVVGDKLVMEALREFDKVDVYDRKGVLQYTITKGAEK